MKIPLMLFSLQFLAVASYTSFPAEGTAVNQEEDSPQCTGYAIDFSRLRSLTKADVNSLIGDDNNISSGSNSLLPEEQEKHTYSRSQTMTIVEGSTADNQAAPPRCLGTRHRLQENMQGVPIYGADILVTTDNCLTNDTNGYDYSDNNIASNYGGSFLTMLADDPAGSSIQRLTGKTFSRMANVPNGYTPTALPQEAVEAIASALGVVDLETVGNPLLQVFISTGGDFLTYRSHVLVEKDGSADLIEIVVDAHDLSILSRCVLNEASEATAERRQRRSLRANAAVEQETALTGREHDHTITNQRELFNCESCATTTPVTWSADTTPCTLSSLYLDDTERSTICSVGTNQNDNSAVVGPGPVADLFWRGTLNCGGLDGTTCTSVVLPDCRDALSDVQFGGITALQYLRDHLGFQGGIHASANEPVAMKAYAHYLKQYCNAFYNPSTNSVYFGDCNCHTWSPLVSLDIVGHELFHGVTYHSSGLVYSGKSGGLNEGYSDIFGTVLEHYIQDYYDTPDFTIAEQVGAVLRNMEFPTSKSIASVCDYTEGLKVHYGSGALNKAFVNAVRSCSANGCSDLAGCTILLGTHFLYSNIYGLTQTSDFLDGAEASCSFIQEYFTVRAPQTAGNTCTPSLVKQFIIEGWETVDVVIDSNCRAASTCPLPPSPSIPNSTPRPTGRPTSVPASTPTDTDADGSDVGTSSSGGEDEESLSCFARIRSAFGRLVFWK